MKIRQTREWVTDKALVGEYSPDLGDKRRNHRVQRVGAAVATKPSLSLPRIFPDEADLEATYRLLRNPTVAWRKLMAAHVERTLDRAENEDEVLVAHDTSELAFRKYWSDEGRGQMAAFTSRTQGFFLHTSVAISANGQALPLGVLHVQPFVHHSGLNEDEARAFWESEAGLFDNEHARWFGSVGVVAEALAKRDIAPIHVMDCETDSYGLLSWLVQNGHRFVIRCDGGRRLKSAHGMREVGNLNVDLGERFDLRDGKATYNPPRRARTVELTVRAGVVTLSRARKAKDASWSPGGFA